MSLEFMFFFPLMLMLIAAFTVAREIVIHKVKTSEILIAAKRHLACTEYEHFKCDNERYICSAIGRVNFRGGGRVLYHKSKALREHIRSQLSPHASVSRWAENNIGYGLSFFEVQTIRHRWVDELIAHYRSIGD